MNETTLENGNKARLVDLNQIYAFPSVARQAALNIAEGRLSMTFGLPVVAKLIGRRGYVILDGNHRLAQDDRPTAVYVEIAEVRISETGDLMTMDQVHKLAKDLGYKRT